MKYMKRFTACLTLALWAGWATVKSGKPATELQITAGNAWLFVFYLALICAVGYFAGQESKETEK